MSIDSPALPRADHPLRSWSEFVIPVAAAVAAVFTIAVFGVASPLTWLVIGPILIAGVSLILQTTPFLMFWLMPASMSVYFYLPVLHYELITAALAVVMLFGGYRNWRWHEVRLEPFEWRYLMFLFSALPGLIHVTRLWRYLGALKFWAFGLIGYEVARRGAHRLGRESMLWGPAIFCAATTLQMVTRVAASGVPGFKATALRSYLTELPWAHANGVAAVMAMCVPALALLISLTPPRSLRRPLAVSILCGALVVILLTASRGPFMLAVGYLLFLTVRMRGSVWITLAVVIAFAATLAATPIGQGFAGRFTDAKAMEGVLFRIITWQLAWRRGVLSFPLGMGAGQGLVQNDELLDLDCHNILLTLFSELGLVATLIWIWI